ncbi:MarR family winged helix-turn-helix transcriptional regulator [Companilactobacillus baiquanensis]|uniref:MarR family winged helix-turn-helix transcriptional regulator n=1 Tax=Companilactobacillus baiquanensis TaxID=2486005 RepID=A0ABW1UYM9_9LACO|nr:MarR family transcriptional regulator [Companilactobacillus baiquanensis]
MEHQFYTKCAYFTAARYMRSVEKIADKIYAPTKMKPAYSYIMMNIEDNDPSSIMSITHQLGYDRSSVSRMVRTLSDKNLVELSSKGRSTIVTLTSEGKDFLVVANKCREKFGQVTDDLLGEDKKKMTALLTSNEEKLRR